MTTTSSTILLVDDDPKTLEIVSHILHDEGYSVVTAGDGWDALELIPTQSFGLVITDLNMPRVTGWELLAEIRKRDPGLPVVLLTAQTSTEAREQASLMGASDYITKPIDLDALVACARRHTKTGGDTAPAI